MSDTYPGRNGNTATPLKPKPQRRHQTSRTIAALMLREMSTRYGRVPGGYLWALIEPLGVVILLALGFSLLVRNPSLGTSFVLFYATGYLSFNLYQNVSLYVSRSIGFSKPLLFYPSVTWVDAVVARFILNTLTGIMVCYVLFTGILLVSDTNTTIDLPPIILSLGLAALLGLGIGVFNCFMIGMVPVYDLIWSIVTRPLFLASGVLFIYEDLPRAVQDILWFNPLMHVTGLMRMGFYPMYAPNYISVTYLLAVGLATLAMGTLLLRRHHRTILNL